MAQNTKNRNEELSRTAQAIVSPEGATAYHTLVISIPEPLAPIATDGAKQALFRHWRDTLIEQTGCSLPAAEQHITRVLEGNSDPQPHNWGGYRRGAGAKPKPKPKKD